MKCTHRLAKYLAKYSSLSRRQAEEAIISGRVHVNGVIVETVVCFVSEEDHVELDRKKVSSENTFLKLWKCYKPRGCLVTRTDPFQRPTIYSMLSPSIPAPCRLLYVGRLDFDSEGLLLMTNTPHVAHVLEKPSYGWVREYEVELQGKVPWKTCKRMEFPIHHGGILYPGCKINTYTAGASSTWISLSLTEGKKREIRNRIQSLGCKVTRLIRVRFAEIELGTLAQGFWEELSMKSWEHVLARCAV